MRQNNVNKIEWLIAIQEIKLSDIKEQLAKSFEVNSKQLRSL